MNSDISVIAITPSRVWPAFDTRHGATTAPGSQPGLSTGQWPTRVPARRSPSPSPLIILPSLARGDAQA